MTNMNKVRSVPNFWKYADTSNPGGCWEWTGYFFNTGYGGCRIKKHLFLAHRVSAFTHGMLDSIEAPKNQKGDGFVLHRCDNKKCVNPLHLEVGTRSKNTVDAYSRGLMVGPIGEINANSKLTAANIIEIRRMARDEGMLHREIGAAFGVTRRHIYKILSGRSWSHI